MALSFPSIQDTTLVVGTVALVAALLAPLPGPAAPPDVGSPDLPHWVPVSKAFTDGEVSGELFDETERRHIRDWLRAPVSRDADQPPDAGLTSKDGAAAECDVSIVTLAGIETPDVSEALGAARLAFTGTVLSMEPGLYRGRLATLVTVEVDRWLITSEEIAPRPVVRLIHHDTRTVIGGRSYCQRHAGREHRLGVGRRLVVATSNVLEVEPLLVLPYERELFFETDRSSVSAAGPLRGAAPADWAGFERHVGRLVRAE